MIGERIVTDNEVVILGYLLNLSKLLTKEKDGQLVIDRDDVVQGSVTVVRNVRRNRLGSRCPLRELPPVPVRWGQHEDSYWNRSADTRHQP